MKKDIVIKETTTVRDFTDCISELFPRFQVTIKNKNYEKAGDNVLLKDLFVFERNLPILIEPGIEFDDTFIRLVTKTGLNMSYAYFEKHEVAEYHLTGDTTIKEITDIFGKHFPLFHPNFYMDNTLLRPESKLKEVFVHEYKLIVYDQYSSTRRHFSADTGIRVVD